MRNTVILYISINIEAYMRPCVTTSARNLYVCDIKSIAARDKLPKVTRWGPLVEEAIEVSS
jgi:hypothetical protein